MNRELALIGVAVIGLITLGVDYFLLEEYVTGDIVEARKNLWANSVVVYLFLLIPPFIMLDPERREVATEAFRVGGLVVIDLAKYISIGVLIYIGLYSAYLFLGPIK